MEAVTVFLNKKYRPQSCCCCFSLKVGTNIIGILGICWNIINLIYIRGISVVGDNENSTVIVIHGESDVTVVIVAMLRIVFLIAAAAMVLGNFKGNKNHMLPFVYLNFGGLIVVMFMNMIVLPLTFFFLGKFEDGLAILVVAIFGIVLGTYCWYIVQCRILELKETARPETLFTHGDPEIPAYGDVTTITSSTDVGSQILQ